MPLYSTRCASDHGARKYTVATTAQKAMYAMYERDRDRLAAHLIE
jgi:hypothetical protein